MDGSDDPFAALDVGSLMAEDQAPLAPELAGRLAPSDLEACLRVLTAMAEDKTLLLHEQLSNVRRSVVSVGSALKESSFSGLSRQDYQDKRTERLNRQARAARLKQADLKHINSVKLRAERINALNSLLEPQLPYIAPKLLTSQPTNLLREPVTITDETEETEKAEEKAEPSSNKQEQEQKQPAKKGKKATQERELSDAEGQALEAQRIAESGVRPKELHYPRQCYTCKKRFVLLHPFYDQLCPTCAELNWRKRHQTADLQGKVCLLTGSRVKIGYYCGLKLLRCGATLIATSRFPHDTARRYAQEKDFESFKDRLHVYGLDLRDLRAVIRFCDLIAERYKRIDVIVNNAAQTIRRPPAYYRHLMPGEMKHTDQLPESLQQLVKGDPHRDASDTPEYIRLIGMAPSASSASSSSSSEAAQISSSASQVTITDVEDSGAEPAAASSSSSTGLDGEVMSAVMGALSTTGGGDGNGNAALSAVLSQVPVAPGDAEHDSTLFPVGLYDVTGQQLDLRHINSWLLLMDQVEPAELVEVFAINALAPFIINSRLKRCMMHEPQQFKYVINVSAMEGKFYRHKGPQHPHTNMAKAALNMMTRTAAQDYAAHNIFMNSVDTGWINDENPFEKLHEIAKQNNFQTPIDEEDAMARILDPVITGYSTGHNPFGKFYKDFHETEW